MIKILAKKNSFLFHSTFYNINPFSFVFTFAPRNVPLQSLYMPNDNQTYIRLAMLILRKRTKSKFSAKVRRKWNIKTVKDFENIFFSASRGAVWLLFRLFPLQVLPDFHLICAFFLCHLQRFLKTLSKRKRQKQIGRNSHQFSLPRQIKMVFFFASCCCFYKLH